MDAITVTLSIPSDLRESEALAALLERAGGETLSVTDFAASIAALKGSKKKTATKKKK